MTMPHERTRAVIQTREFLVELSRDGTLPDRIRNGARHLLRHYPSEYDVRMAGKIEENAKDMPFPLWTEIFSSETEYCPRETKG